MSLSITHPLFARQSLPLQAKDSEHLLVEKVKNLFNPVDVKKLYETARFYDETRNKSLGLSKVEPLKKIAPEDFPKPLLFRDIFSLFPSVTPNAAIQTREREFSQDRQSFSDKICETNRRYNIFSFYKTVIKQRPDTLSPSRFAELSRKEQFLKGAEEGAYYFPSIILGSMVTTPLVNILGRHCKSQFFDRSSLSLFRSMPFSELFLSAVIVAPICEELLYRSLFQNIVWYTTGSKESSLFFSHLGFAFAHHSPQTPFILLNNPVYSLLYYESDSVWPSIGAHAANNFLAISLFTAGRMFRK